MTRSNEVILEKDFYTNLKAEIDTKHIAHAVEMVAALPDIDQQLEVLAHLGNELISTRDSARSRLLGHALDNLLALAHASNRVQVRVRLGALMRSLERARVYAYSLASVMTRDTDRAAVINKVIINCLDTLAAKYKRLAAFPGWEIETPHDE
ncbi:MAG: hypothetical protein R3E39_18530 [Anaerolineae bacterium]